MNEWKSIITIQFCTINYLFSINVLKILLLRMFSFFKKTSILLIFNYIFVLKMIWCSCIDMKTCFIPCLKCGKKYILNRLTDASWAWWQGQIAILELWELNSGWQFPWAAFWGSLYPYTAEKLSKPHICKSFLWY